MGPIATGLGEVYMYTVEYEHPRGEGAPAARGAPGWQGDGSYRTPEGELLRTDVELAGYLRTVQELTNVPASSLICPLDPTAPPRPPIDR